MMRDYSLLVAPSVEGCAWVQVKPRFVGPSCAQEPRYVVTGTLYPDHTALACEEHVAAFRALHPEQIKVVRSLGKGS